MIASMERILFWLTKQDRDYSGLAQEQLFPKSSCGMSCMQDMEERLRIEPLQTIAQLGPPPIIDANPDDPSSEDISIINASNDGDLSIPSVINGTLGELDDLSTRNVSIGRVLS